MEMEEQQRHFGQQVEMIKSRTHRPLRSREEQIAHTYSWQQPADLGDLRPDIDKLLEQKDGVQLT